MNPISGPGIPNSLLPNSSEVVNPYVEIFNKATATQQPLNDLTEGFLKQCYILERHHENLDFVFPGSELLPKALKTQFGEDLVNRIMERYGLSHKKTFTLAEYKALIIGIASGVRRSDLESRYNELKKNGDAAFTPFASFDDVTDPLIGKLHDHFITSAHKVMEVKHHLHQSTVAKVLKIVFDIFLVLSCLALVSVGVLAFVASFPLSATLAIAAIAIGATGLLSLSAYGIYLLASRPPQAPYHDKLVQDKDFIKTCKLAHVFNFEKNQHIAASEYLSHDVAYADLIEGQILPVKEKDNHFTYVKVSKIINKEGYVCFILTPLQEKMHQDEFQVRVLYRGTHDTKSLRRLQEPYSAGHLSFKHNQKELLESIAEVVPAVAKHVQTEYYGHSLGGADAQRAANITAFAIAKISSVPQVQKEEEANFKRVVKYFEGPNWDKIRSTIEKINVVKTRFWNSAGITHSTNNDFKHWIKVINNPANGTQPKCQFKILECKVAGDLVQRSGQTTLGHGMGNTIPNLEREVYQFRHGYEGATGFLKHLGPMATAKAHQVKNLNRDSNKGKDPTHIYANCRTNLAFVEQSSGDHMTWPTETWQKVKLFMMSYLFGSSMNYNGKYYNPFALPEEAFA